MKNIFVLLLLTIVGHISFGQDLSRISNALKDDDRNIIRAATDSSLCVVRVYYNVSDTSSGKIYARKNKGYFSMVCFAGVLADGKLFVPAGVVKPWEQDASFETY